MHLVLTGATGLVGSAVLRAMLDDAAVRKVTILSRRAVPMAEGHAKAEVILHDDFLRYDAAAGADAKLAAALASASGAVWALGTSQNAVPAKLYEQITFDYALAFARFWTGLPAAPATAAASAAGAQEHSPAHKTLVFVSGEGATHSPGMLTPRFGTVKGRAEQALLELTAADPALTVWAARPGGVDPRSQAEIKAFIPPVPTYKAGLMAAMTALTPGMMSPTGPMARVMLDLAKGSYATKEEGEKDKRGGGKSKEIRVEGGQGKMWRGGVVRNAELRRLAGL